MRTMLIGLAAATALAAGAGTAVSAPAIPMSGAQEADAADPDGHGFFTYQLDGTTFCYSLRWTGIETATAAHVHLGPRHVAGPVVIPLSIGDGSGAPVSACTTILDTTLAQAIEDDPKAYYVNVHNAEFPAGAIRGQLKGD
jgi:CHRD domain